MIVGGDHQDVIRLCQDKSGTGALRLLCSEEIIGYLRLARDGYNGRHHGIYHFGDSAFIGCIL